MSTVEIRELLGVVRQRAYQITQQSGFPPPVAELGIGKVWDGYEVRQWAAATGRIKQPTGIDLSGDVVKLASVESFSLDQIKTLASGGSVTIPFSGIFDNGATDAPKDGE